MTLITKRNMSAGRRALAIAVLGAAFLLPAAPAAAGDDSAVAIDDSVIEKQISANEARRAAYKYLAAQGYSRKIGPGSARVRSITRDGDTWIIQISMSNGTSVQADKSMLYIDAKTALVSEVAPEGLPSRVAAE